eukprot:CAMPEP_0119370988 /NCGR_PEP_ID=MMETSP1334-20130426/17255_1 /TAXON_ID=127549 /ORGANISM="Calcidiscus leptoporus, Strain RCC1130" /LENGTH=188 /DNA_ID=CAMNT_0007388173 /DNA_START=162 /DNA_END=728 /DNA_ORIENTATION=+
MPVGCLRLHLAAATLARSLSSSSDWQTLPGGVRMKHISDGGQGDYPVKEGQTVRITYVARLDDGSICARGTSSFKIGHNAVCAALEHGIVGMRIGDRRRLRVAAYSPRGALLASVPEGEVVEYNVQLTGAVHHMQIVTLQNEGDDDPLQMFWDFTKRSLVSLFPAINGKKKKEVFRACATAVIHECDE